MQEVKLSTPQEMADKANSVDVGIHGEEKPRFSFRGYICKVFGKWCGRFNFTINW